MKTKKMLILILQLLLYGHLKSQDTFAVNPGGVKGAKIWYATGNADPLPAVCFYNKLNGLKIENSFAKPAGTLINFHPACVFTAADYLHIALGKYNSSNNSYFTVYQCTDTSENSVWHITRDEKTALVLTTRRLADLETGKYMNYTDLLPAVPKLSIYIQHKDSAAGVSSGWQIGTKPTTPKLPVSLFNGLVPEFILFDHALTSSERIQVSSYLSLKYGITLTDPQAIYRNSNAETIWDGLQYSSYHINIAGLCRDDSSGLLQKIATSSNTPGLLTIATTDSLTNNSSILWGENGLPFISDKKLAGVPPLLQKKWIAVVHGNTAGISTEVIIDTKKMDVPLPVKPVFWLAVDRTGNAQFASPAKEFIKMSGLDASGFAHFKNITWDTDGSGKDAFAFIAGQDLLLLSAIRPPSCDSANKGSMQVKIMGGTAPYRLFITDKSGERAISSASSGDSLITISSITAGAYTLSVIDARQLSYADTFYVNNADAPDPVSVDDNYILPAGGTLLINAASQMPAGITYEWRGPGDFYQPGPNVAITKPGAYTLKCDRNGCPGIKKIIVAARQINPFSSIVLFPNPTTGVFSIKITAVKTSAIDIHVYSSNGKSVKLEQVKGRSNYLLTMQLPEPGLYELLFTSGSFTTSRKLIVAK